MLSKKIKNNHWSKSLPNSAFTLIEILITVAIFIIITTIIVVNFNFKTPKDALNQAVEQVITFYRQAQTATMTGVKVGSTSSTYGFFLSTEPSQKNQVIIFVDLDGDKNYDVGEEDKSACSSCGIITLPNGIEISAVTPFSGNSLTIMFSATNTNDVYFNSSALPATVNGTITITNPSIPESRNIYIYHTSGQISR